MFLFTLEALAKILEFGFPSPARGEGTFLDFCKSLSFLHCREQKTNSNKEKGHPVRWPFSLCFPCILLF